jgi:alpha-mannosidase
LLKVAFPVDVLSPKATYEIQWGNVERPTHRNTSWDWARFETAAQKWVDLSEGGYGVSLLNDCKYGHDIHDNVIRLTLLRGTTAPDPGADLGEHHFAYSLLPHQGSWGQDTIGAAYALNDALITVQGNGAGGQSPTPPLVAPQAANIVIETIKRAEDRNGIIVRLYESQRQRGRFTLETGFPIQAAWLTNILEENGESLQVERNQIHLSIRPYQILTLRLIPDPQPET